MPTWTVTEASFGRRNYVIVNQASGTWSTTSTTYTPIQKSGGGDMAVNIMVNGNRPVMIGMTGDGSSSNVSEIGGVNAHFIFSEDGTLLDTFSAETDAPVDAADHLPPSAFFQILIPASSGIRTYAAQMKVSGSNTAYANYVRIFAIEL